MVNNGRLDVQVTVFNGTRYESGFPPEDLPGFVDWLNAKIAEIPLEHRANAKIEITSHSSYYDSCESGIEITYRRPETDAQYKSRLKREEEEEKAKALAQERNELAILAALQKKYAK